MTDLPPPEEDWTAEAAEYVLRLLPPDEEAAFEAEMAQNPALRDQVAGWLRHFEGLNAGFAETAPRPAIKGALFTRLFGDETPRRVSFWDRAGLWRGISLAALALAAVMTTLWLWPAERTGPGYVSEIAAEDGSLRLFAVYDPAQGGLRISRIAGTAPAGRVLELWAISGDAAPVSLGVLPETPSALLPLPDSYRSAAGLFFAITDEPPGGAPGGTATGEIRATGEVHDL